MDLLLLTLVLAFALYGIIKLVSAEIRSSENSRKKPNTEKIGSEFEAFVVQKFDKEYFNLLEWRSDKITQGIYPKSSSYPDLEFELVTKSARTKLAIECKYRAAPFNGKVEIAKDYQLDNYRDYSQEYMIPVFIILGLGGTPSEPDDLFIIPLNKIKWSSYFMKSLKPYKRYGKSKFFYSPVYGTLS